VARECRVLADSVAKVIWPYAVGNIDSSSASTLNERFKAPSALERSLRRRLVLPTFATLSAHCGRSAIARGGLLRGGKPTTPGHEVRAVRDPTPSAQARALPLGLCAIEMEDVVEAGRVRPERRHVGSERPR